MSTEPKAPPSSAAAGPVVEHARVAFEVPDELVAHSMRRQRVVFVWLTIAIACGLLAPFVAWGIEVTNGRREAISLFAIAIVTLPFLVALALAGARRVNDDGSTSPAGCLFRGLVYLEGFSAVLCLALLLAVDFPSHGVAVGLLNAAALTLVAALRSGRLALYVASWMLLSMIPTVFYLNGREGAPEHGPARTPAIEMSQDAHGGR